MLAAQDGDKVAVAAALGVSERSLYRKLSGNK
jgi:transcriptional regulator with PAS, ATPase and Fis domain